MKKFINFLFLSIFTLIVFPNPVDAKGDCENIVPCDLNVIADHMQNQCSGVMTKASDLDHVLFHNLPTQRVVVQIAALVGSQKEGIVRSILPEETVSVVVSQETPSDLIGFGSHATLMNNQKQIQTVEAQGALPGETVEAPVTFSSQSVVPRGNQTPGETVAIVDVVNAGSVRWPDTRNTGIVS